MFCGRTSSRSYAEERVVTHISKNLLALKKKQRASSEFNGLSKGRSFVKSVIDNLRERRLSMEFHVSALIFSMTSLRSNSEISLTCAHNCIKSRSCALPRSLATT